MSRVATPELQANDSGFQIQLVVDDDELTGGNFVKGQQCLHGRPRHVHEGRERSESEAHTRRVFYHGTHPVGFELLKVHPCALRASRHS